MNQRQLNKLSARLATSLLVIFDNREGRLAASKIVRRPVSEETLNFEVHTLLAPAINVNEIRQEIQKSIPDSVITDELVDYALPSIEFTVKELGKNGIYQINLLFVHPYR